MAETESGAEGLGALVKDLVTYFYVENELVLSTQMERLQRLFDVLIKLLDQFDTQKNIRNKVSMACRTCHTPGGMSEVAYERRVTGVGTTYLERQMRWLQ